MTATVFAYTGSSQTYLVPAGVTRVAFEIRGAKGAGTSPGLGQQFSGVLAVTPGETLTINVGGQGGWNGGGAGANGGGNGGGATDLRQGGTGLANRKIVAAGGGGGGTQAGGGSASGTTGGAGLGVGGGGGGTSTAGGAAGASTAPVAPATAGSSGQGGTGGTGATTGGGGGGGGYYGGGGGGTGATEGSGGGAGSSYSTVTGVTYTTHSDANGSLKISPVENCVSTAWTGHASLPLNSIIGAAAVLSTGTIHAVVQGQDYSNEVHAYSYTPATDTIAEVPCPTRSEAGGAPTLLPISQNGDDLWWWGSGHSGTGGNHLYVLNQYDEGGNVTSSQLGWWTDVIMPRGRYYHMAARVGGLTYIFGGRLPGGSTTTIVDVYNHTADTWATTTPIPTAMADGVAVVIDGIIYYSQAGSAMWTFTPGTSTWASTPVSGEAIEHRAKTYALGRIWAVGGRFSGDTASTPRRVQSWAPGEASWRNEVSLPSGRQGSAAAAWNGNLWVCAGTTATESKPALCLRIVPTVTGGWSVGSIRIA